MRETPRVSVVMSVYNDAIGVRAVVASIQQQTFDDWEFVIVDDGSTDETSEVLADLAAADPRLRVITQENAGLTRALVVGCDAATARYIARQDSDDLSHASRLADQLAFLEADENVGFVASSVQVIGPRDEPLEQMRRDESPDTISALFRETMRDQPAHGSVMFRKSLYEAVGGYRPEFYYAQDSDLWLRMIDQSQLGYVSDVRYMLRRSSGSITGSDGDAQSQFGELARQCRRVRLAGESEKPFLAEAAALTKVVRDRRLTKTKKTSSTYRTDYMIGSQLVRNGDRRGIAYLVSVLRARPWHSRAWIRLAQGVVVGMKSLRGGRTSASSS